MFETFTARTIPVGDADIACVVGGKGPPLLLLHGYPQNKAMWARVAPALSQQYTVVCADLRGYGDSSKPRCLPDNSNYSFRAMAADQLGLMRALGFDRFHVIGHDRGGRTGHRLALDHPDAVLSLTVMDIVPTYAMFMETNRQVAGAYWHWYFLSQPEPFPERLIGNDPDFFYETCLVGWGATRITDFDQEMLADYRRVACPTLVFYGSKGQMARLFDLPDEWRKRFVNPTEASLPGGHFFVDQFPDQVILTLREFLESTASTSPSAPAPTPTHPRTVPRNRA